MFLHHSKIKEDGNLECLKCYGRQHPLEPFLTYSGPSGKPSLFFHCSDCRSKSADSSDQKHELDYQVYPKSKTYVLSVAGMPNLPQSQKAKAIEPMNFFDMQVDKLIVNVQSPGYNQSGILYLPNKNLLVACSKNGRIDIWSMGDDLKPVTDFSVGNSVKCVKYFVTAKGRSLLAIGVSTEIQVYEIQGNKPELIKILDCKSDVKSLEYVAKELTEDGRLVSVSADNILREWNITSFKCCSERSLKENNILEPPSRILYLREKGMLALNSPNEIHLIKLDDKNFSKRILSHGAKISMGYLPNKHQLVVRADRISVALLDIANDFEKNICGIQTILDSLVPETTYIANQDETQMIYNKDSNTIMVHDFEKGVSPKGFDDIRNLVQSISAIETIPNQNRLIIGDDSTGTILILRTNIKSTDAAPRGQIRKIFEEVNENNAIPLPSGGSFGNSNGTSADSSVLGKNLSKAKASDPTPNKASASRKTAKSSLNKEALANASKNKVEEIKANTSRPAKPTSKNQKASPKKVEEDEKLSTRALKEFVRIRDFNSKKKEEEELVWVVFSEGNDEEEEGGSKFVRKTPKNQRVEEEIHIGICESDEEKEEEDDSKIIKSSKKRIIEEEIHIGQCENDEEEDSKVIRRSPKKRRNEEEIHIGRCDSESPEREERKRGRSNSPQVEKGKKERQNSEEKEKDRSRSRSKNPDVNSRKSIHETIKGAKELVKGIRLKMNARIRKQENS